MTQYYNLYSYVQSKHHTRQAYTTDHSNANSRILTSTANKDITVDSHDPVAQMLFHVTVNIHT